MMRFRSAAVAAAFATSMLAHSGTAEAQKSKDTLRVAVTEPIRFVDGLFHTGIEALMFDRVVQSTLMHYDPVTKELKPSLATSWTRIDDATIEFKLRQGVKFHDGSEFDADDVVYTIDVAIDPKYNFRLKESRFGFLAGAEKMDKHTVRIRVKKGSGVDLINLASNPPIVPSDVHGKLENKNDFGRAPVGTGPYRLASIESTGVVLQRNPDYAMGDGEPAAKIGRIDVTAIGDKQTQIAKVLTDEIDLIFQVDYEQAKDIAQKKPNYKIRIAPTVSFIYMTFDTANRSGASPFHDARLREALLSAVDRDQLRKVFLPPEISSQPPMDSLCHGWLIGCSGSMTKPPAYDPERAKQLLREAGHGNGLDLEILTWGPSKAVAEAVAGDLRKVGVRASVNAPAVQVFQKLRGEGKAAMQVTLWDNSGGQPDIDNTARYFFGDTAQNYARDPELRQLVDDARAEFDNAKREAVYRKLFNTVTERRYMAPIVELPALQIHHKDVAFDQARLLNTQGFMFNRLGWAK